MAARKQTAQPAAPVQLASPYTTLAYSMDPTGGVSALTGYPSVYPHVLQMPYVPPVGYLAPTQMSETEQAFADHLMRLAMQGARGAGAGAPAQRAAVPTTPTAPAAPALAPSHVPFQPQAPALAPSHATAQFPPLAPSHIPYQVPALAPSHGVPAQLPPWAGMYDPSLATEPGIDIPIEAILAAFQTPPSTALGAQAQMPPSEPVTSAAQLGISQLMYLMQQGSSPTATPLEQAQAQWARAMITSPQRATALPSVMSWRQ